MTLHTHKYDDTENCFNGFHSKKKASGNVFIEGYYPIHKNKQLENKEIPVTIYIKKLKLRRRLTFKFKFKF